jgi:5-methylcytosine-specific restriction endonuclease McrA
MAERLLIRYRTAEDEVTERVISEVIVEPPHAVHAFCHLREEQRTFALSRIEQAVNVETDEVIEDVWEYFGLTSRKVRVLQMPVFDEHPRRLCMEEAQRQRTADKRALFGRFGPEVVQVAKRVELLGLFGSRCFRCGAGERLELDHHVSQYYGGRLVPGNVAVLCFRCNADKGNRHPSRFYATSELERLKPLLEAELRLFDFSFDWSRWHREPEEYLLWLGVPEAEVEAAVRERESGIGVILTARMD